MSIIYCAIRSVNLIIENKNNKLEVYQLREQINNDNDRIRQSNEAYFLRIANERIRNLEIEENHRNRVREEQEKENDTDLPSYSDFSVFSPPYSLPPPSYSQTDITVNDIL